MELRPLRWRLSWGSRGVTSATPPTPEDAENEAKFVCKFLWLGSLCIYAPLFRVRRDGEIAVGYAWDKYDAMAHLWLGPLVIWPAVGPMVFRKNE